MIFENLSPVNEYISQHTLMMSMAPMWTRNSGTFIRFALQVEVLIKYEYEVSLFDSI